MAAPRPVNDASQPQQWYDAARTGNKLGNEMLSDIAEFVIHGKTLEGEIFQPHDWAERLCGDMSGTIAAGGKVYPDYVRPIISGGIASLVVRVSLKRDNADAFAQIKRFIADNHLVVRSGRGSRDAEHTGPISVFAGERRKPGSNNT